MAYFVQVIIIFVKGLFIMYVANITTWIKLPKSPDSLTRNVHCDGNMFPSTWPRLGGDTIQSRVIVIKCRHKCEHVNRIDQIPKVMWLRVVSVNVTSCCTFLYYMKRNDAIIIVNSKRKLIAQHCILHIPPFILPYYIIWSTAIIIVQANYGY